MLIVGISVVGLRHGIGRRRSHPGGTGHRAEATGSTTAGIVASMYILVLASVFEVEEGREDIRKKEEYNQCTTDNDGEKDPAAPVGPRPVTDFPAILIPTVRC